MAYLAGALAAAKADKANFDRVFFVIDSGSYEEVVAAIKSLNGAKV